MVKQPTERPMLPFRRGKITARPGLIRDWKRLRTDLLPQQAHLSQQRGQRTGFMHEGFLITVPVCHIRSMQASPFSSEPRHAEMEQMIAAQCSRRWIPHTDTAGHTSVSMSYVQINPAIMLAMEEALHTVTAG